MADPSATPILFDRALLLQRLARAQSQGAATFLLDRVCEDMEERLSAVKREFTEVADIWTPGAGFSPHARFKSFRHIAQAGDEVVPLSPESLDLALSALAFQFVNDLPGVLAQIRRALRPDGLLLDRRR
jgi:SAM-dependent methyltransferase